MADVSNEHYKKMTEWPVGKLVVTLAIPTTISMLITNIYNMADTYFVGTINNSASGAIGVVFGLMAIIQAFGFMFGHGAGSIVARLLGKKDASEASKYTSTSFFSSLLVGLMITLLGFAFLNPLLRLLGSTETILPYARDYAKYILLAAPFMASSCVMNNVLRYEGKANLAMIGLTTGGILNIFGDALTIKFLNMGVAGAGLATAVSQTISFIILLSVFLLGKTQSKISLSLFLKNIKKTGIICRTGLPSLMRQGLNSIATSILNNCAGVYGDTAIAAMSIVNKICFFIFAVGLGIGQGFQPVSATNYGAKKYSRVRKSFFFTLFTAEALLGLLAIIGIIASGNLISLFRDDIDVIKIGTIALRFQLISLFFQPLTVVSNMLFQSIGKNLVATILSTLRSGVCFIPAVLLLSFFCGITGVEMAQAVADVIAFVIAVPFVIDFMKKLPRVDGMDI